MSGGYSFPSMPGSFNFHLPDSTSSGSASRAINPTFPHNISSNFFIDPTSTSNTVSSEDLSFINPPSSSTVTDTSSGTVFTPLNNATNHTTSAQFIPQHGTYLPPGLQSNARENVLLSDNATVPGGLKRKVDPDENCPGPDLKKARSLPITQEPLQTPFIIPPQLQGSQAWPQQPQDDFNGTASACLPGVQLGDFYIPPEIIAIKIELNNLFSLPVNSSVRLPPYIPLLTALIVRSDVPNSPENRFYPYLWFPNRPPYMLQEQDYRNILCLPLASALKKALQRLGMECGTLCLTASRQVVIFFQVEERVAVEKAIKNHMGPSSRWLGAKEIPGQNNLVAYMGHRVEQDAQGGSSSNALQSNTGPAAHQTESNPGLHNDPTTGQQTQATTGSLPSTSSRKRSATHKQPAQNANTFVLVGPDTAKRRRNGPPPGIPIIMPVSDASQAVSEPSTSYPINTVFAETHTKESYPHPQNPNAKKRKPRARASAKTRAQLESKGEIPLKQKARPGKRPVKKDQDPELSEIQAGPSGTRALEPETQPVSQQVSNNILYQSASSHIPPTTLGYTQYGSAMTNQAFASQEATQLWSAGTLGGCYAPLSAETTDPTSQAAYAGIFGGYDQFGATHTAQYPIPDQTGYTEPTLAVSTTNQATLPNIVTGCETENATTSQISLSQPSADPVNVSAADRAFFNQLFAAVIDESQVPAQPLYPDVPVYPHAQFDGQQVDNQDPLGQGQASLPEADIAAFGSNNWQPDFNLDNFADPAIFNFIYSMSEQSLRSDNVEEAFNVQPQGSAPGFPGPFVGDFAG